MSKVCERFYTIAGITFRVEAPEDQLYQEEGVLTSFRGAASHWDHELRLEILDQLPAPEGELVFADPGKRVYVRDDIQIRYEGALEKSLDGAYMRTCRRGDISLVQVKRQAIRNRMTTKIVLNAIEAEHQIVQHGGILLHASCIRWGNRAILFTAPSGTGKSTQADLWCRLRGTELINGDRASVFWDENNMPHVRGIPFPGSSGVCKNVTLPLAAIVYLSQAPSTTIVPLAGFRAFRNIWEGCSVNTWNRSDVEACSAKVMEIVQRVPVFHLACTPDESAVIALEHELKKLR